MAPHRSGPTLRSPRSGTRLTPLGGTLPTALAARTTRLGWLAADAVHRDHPFNLARRTASLDHFASGRTGLVLGLRDAYAPVAPAGHQVWGGAGLSDGVPFGVATTRDAATVIQELWQSWPLESIVADASTGIYADGAQIHRIDHRGVFDIDGPLTVPSSVQGSPVLAWRATSLDEAAAAREVADIVIWPAAAGSPDDVLALPGTAAVFVEADDLVASDDRVSGVIVRPAPGIQSLERLLDGPPSTSSGTLRERLSLPASPVRLRATTPAFAAPTPQPRRDVAG